MATNFPTSYDDVTTHGGPFIDVAAPADPQRNIAAVYRNNLNDIVVAIENKLGFTGETTDTTVDWALMTIGGTPNQGLRFAGASATWPGLVAEDGVFIATGTGNVSYHKGGDPVGTFVDLTTGAGATWDSIYAADKDLDINSGELEWIIPSAATFYDFVIRNDAGTPEEFIRVDGSARQVILGDVDGAARIDIAIEGKLVGDLKFDGSALAEISNTDDLFILGDGSDIIFKANGSALTNLNSVGDLNLATTSTNIFGAINEVNAHDLQDKYDNGQTIDVNAADLELIIPAVATFYDFVVRDNSGTQLEYIRADGSAGQLILGDTAGSTIDLVMEGAVVSSIVSVPPAPTAPFDAHSITMTSGGLDNEAMQGLVIDLTSNVGDLNSTPIRGIQLDFTDLGGSSEARAINIGANWDFGLRSASPVQIDSTLTLTSQLDLGDDIPLRLGDAPDSTVRWSTVQTNDALIWGVGDTSRSMIICEQADATSDFGHADAAASTVFLHSNLAPATDTGEFLGLSYLGLQGGEMSTDRVTFDLTVKPVDAWASAVTNVTGGKLILEGGAGVTATDGGIVQVGSGFTTSHSLDSENDLGVTGDFEVNGFLWADANIATSAHLYIGDTGSTFSMLRSSQAEDWTGFFLGTALGRQFIFGDRSWATKDSDHATPTDPEVYIHSVLDPDTDNGEYLGLSYLGLQGGAMETDRATFDFTLKPVDAWASAVTNVTGGKLILEGGAGVTATDGGIVQVGSGFATSHTLNSENDLGVLGDFEVDGSVFFDGTLNLSAAIGMVLESGKNIFLGTSGADSRLLPSSAAAQLILGIHTAHGRGFVICDKLQSTKAFDHAVQTDPTIFTHSVLDPDTDNGEFLGLSYLGLQGGTMETDRATYDLTIKASNAFASATGGNRNAGDLILEGGTGQAATFDGIVQVGSGFTTSHSLDASGDLGVGGELEVDGAVFFDNVISMTPANPTAPLDIATITATSGGLDNEALQGLVINLTSNASDLNTTPINGIQLNFTDPGGSSEARGIDIGAGWDFGLVSASLAQFESICRFGIQNEFMTSNGGTTQAVRLRYTADDGFHISLNTVEGQGNNNLILTTLANDNKDHDHDVASADPTFIVHSVLDPDTDFGEFLGLSYLGLQGGIMETDRATFDLTVNAVDAFGSATTNTTGGDVVLQAGAGTAAAGDGSLLIKQPTGSATLGTYFPDGRLYMDSSPGSSQGTIVATNDGVTASDSLLMYLGDGDIAGFGTTTADRLIVFLNGSTEVKADSTGAALRIEQQASASGGPILLLVDDNASTTRFTTEQDGRTDIEANSSVSALRVGQLGSGIIFGAYDGGAGSGTLRAEITEAGRLRVISSPSLASEAVQIDQQDANEEFIYFNGTASDPAAGVAPADNITEVNGAGAVVGPQTTSGSPDTGWAFNSMIKIRTDAVGGGTVDVWIPGYTPVTS